MSSEEVHARLVKVERALEIEALEKRQADYDATETAAVGELLASLNGVNRACLRVGSILVVKFPVNGEPAIFVRNLSQLELRTLERFPEIQSNPERVFQALATALSATEAQLPG